MRVGVRGFTFDSAHYTKGASEKCLSLHGHTFRLDVEVEGEIDPDTGMVLDFLSLKGAVREILADYDHKVILPRKDADAVVLSGLFRWDVKVIEHPEATTEYLALDIAREVYEKLKMAVRVTLYEGPRNYVVVEYRG